MARESRADREEREEVVAAEAAAEKEFVKEGKAPAGNAAVLAELQNLEDRVSANQADETARSFEKIRALLAGEK